VSNAASIAPKLLTAREASVLVSKLTGRRCSPRRLGYLLLGGGIGTDVEPRRRGQTRLYGAIDLALVRLGLLLEEEGISPWVARVVLTYLRNDLVMAWRAASPLALAVTGVRGTLEPALKTRPAWATAWVPLREVWRDLEREIRRVRDAHPSVWMWREMPAGRAANSGGRTS
jgi:hypothetical protein